MKFISIIYFQILDKSCIVHVRFEHRTVYSITGPPTHTVGGGGVEGGRLVTVAGVCRRL